MRHLSRKDFKHEGDILLFEGKPFMAVIRDQNHSGMWRVEYPDGVLSQDFYNKTRAKDHCVKEAMRIKGLDWQQDVQE